MNLDFKEGWKLQMGFQEYYIFKFWFQGRAKVLKLDFKPEFRVQIKSEGVKLGFEVKVSI